MTTGLKTTLIASLSIMGLLNLFTFAATYNQHAQASFAPGWAETVSAKSSPGPATVTQATPATSLPSDAAPTTDQPAAEPTPNLTAPDPVLAAQTKLTAAGLKPTFAANYLAVQARTGTPWQLLAAVHSVETGQSGDTTRTSSAGATGPMQFMPATFAHYALDGDGDGTATISDLDDALLTAGRYLAAGGADKGNYRNALYNYNHSDAYVTKVLWITNRLGL